MKRILKTTRKNFDTTGGTWNGLTQNLTPYIFPVDNIQIIAAGDSYNGNGFEVFNPASYLNTGLPTYAADAAAFNNEGMLQGLIVLPNGKAGNGFSGSTYGLEVITGTSTSDISNAGVVTDTNADFIADGIKPGDAFYNGGQYCVAVKSVDSPTQLTLFIHDYPNPANQGGLTANDYRIYKDPGSEARKIAEFIADANNNKIQDVFYEATFNVVG